MGTTSGSAGAARPTAAGFARAMDDYCAAGVARAAGLGNRGPLVMGADGRIDPGCLAAILAAYDRTGFYVLEGVLDAAEVADLRAGIDGMLARAPVHPGATVDAAGRPSLATRFERDTYLWATPLSDPVGGTRRNGGRHPEKMVEPVPDAGAPEHIVHMMFGMCQAMDAGLRLYGHPGLLALAEAINGPDFTAYTDAIFVKQPGLGASVAWHQDGLTHWDSPQWDPHIHGFNYQAQLYDCTPANGLWVVPGTHRLGRVDIRARVAANGGSTALPDAVPLHCRAGDVTLVNRQALHGSFANTSPDLRVSLTFGFHRRAAVVGQRGVLGMSPGTVYDDAHIRARCNVIAWAIEARRQHRPDEVPFSYQPLAAERAAFHWDDAARERLRNYNRYDLGI